MSAPRVMVEGLRSGIPYPEVARSLTVGQAALLEEFTGWLDLVAEGRRPKLWGKILRAQYGEGKTHLLYALRDLAGERGWVVSLVSISKETPLKPLERIYAKIVDSVMRPGHSLAGLEPLVREALAAPYVLSEARALDLSPRVAAVWDNLSRQSEGFDELIADLSGYFLKVSDLKRIHRANFQRPLALPRPSLRDDIPSYLRLVNWLIQKAGYSGWLLLFDEVELIGKFGRGERAQSYANLGRLLAGVADRTLSVWAVAGNFQTDVIDTRNELEEVPKWLAARPAWAGEVHFATLALEELVSAAPLPPLSLADLKRLVATLYDLHREAYVWDPPVAREDFFEVVRSELGTQDARLRTWVRAAIHTLDLWFQYGLGGLAVRAEAAGDVDLTEETAE
ncbi:MAG: DUF2791 family P-loop domain-containing protein [Firmicutes bacterium]|nr:DUF2791 family P-loop domain-containing protein [Bacillota bacterium]